MKRIFSLCAILLMLASCASNVKSVIVDDNGKVRKADIKTSAYIALGRGINDTAFTQKINFEGKQFYGPIVRISSDSLNILTTYNGCRMLIKLKSKPQTIVEHDGRANR